MEYKGKVVCADESYIEEVKVAGQSRDVAELIIYGRGSCMNAVVGRYRNGQYICIPDLDTGCPLSRLTDTFWNRERLSSYVTEADAITIAHVLKAVSEYLGGGNNFIKELENRLSGMSPAACFISCAGLRHNSMQGCSIWSCQTITGH